MPSIEPAKDVPERPLCVFCMSPPWYTIRSHSGENSTTASRRRPESCWRPDAHSLRSIRRFNRRDGRRRRSLPLTRTVAGLFKSNRHKFLDLEQILKIIQPAWNPPELDRSFVFRNNKEIMDSSSQKSSSHTSNEISPVLLRRRLSAPETVMRKHILSQERSHSQESKYSSFEKDTTTSSDPNLLPKRDSSHMRKSALLRRLWNNTHNNKSNSRLSGSFNEWQYISGKLSPGKSTQSLTSTQSSPEHKNKNRVCLSPRKASPKNINLSPKRNISVSNGNSSGSSINSVYSSQQRKSLDKEESGSSITASKYSYSSFTSFSDNDSAFSNSSQPNVRYNNTSSETITKQYEENEEIFNENANETLRIKIDQNSNSDTNIHESTQTPDITNLNVISNVKLSQYTLDVIFNQIMKEVNNLVPGDININTTTVATNSNQPENVPQIINVQSQPQQQVSSFFLKPKEDSSNKSPQHSRLDKYIISNVNSGSSYTKPSEIPQVIVPRYSALPRTSSMEVNTSNGDSEEKDESDCVSLVDSLEDFNSPRIKNHDEKIVRGLDITQLLPESTEKERSPKKSASMFFIPIEINKQKENKAVSEFLPSKVREKLSKRQQKREEKNQQAKVKVSSDSNYMSASETHLFADTESENYDYPSKIYSYDKKHKSFLPNIDSVKNKSDKQSHKKKSKPINRMFDDNVPKRKHSIFTSTSSKPRRKSFENSSNDSEPIRIYQKTEYKNSRKRIEIVEFAECIDSSEKNNTFYKNPKEKSKIPVPVFHQSTQKNLKECENQPFLYEYKNDTQGNSDSKIDQLIANILIDTLNNPCDAQCLDNKNNIEDQPQPKTVSGKPQLSSRYQQKFEIIPEETSFQSTEDKSETKPSENNNLTPYQGKAAVSLVQDENFTAIPKGWITFYTLHKDIGTPDSTSDEGKHLDNSLQNQNKCVNSNAVIVKKNNEEDVSRRLEERTGFRSGNSSSYQRTIHSRVNDQSIGKTTNLNKGEWSVTISGSSTFNQSAPDLEMRLKFPQKNSNELKNVLTNNSETSSCVDSNITGRLSSCFPKINNKTYQYQSRDKRKNGKGRDIFHENLPRIHKAKQNQKDSSSIISLYHNVIPSVIIPRQNKASTVRCNINRPIRDQYSLPNVSSISTAVERQYSNVLQKYPEMLSVTGRSISPERKSTIASLSERD